MNDITAGLVVGALSGSRSMLGPSIAAGRRSPGLVSTGIRILAAGELIADKHPSIGNRTDPVPFAGRIISGAIAGAALSRRPQDRLSMAAAGAAGAIASTLLLFHLRREISRRYDVSNVSAGIAEDVLALAASTWLSRRLSR